MRKKKSAFKTAVNYQIFLNINIFQVLDEPLYVIRQIDGILSISGQTIVNHFKEALSRPGMQQPEDDDTFFESESLFQRFPDDKTPLFNLMLSSQACFILLYLKNFLMKLYGFSEQLVLFNLAQKNF